MAAAVVGRHDEAVAAGRRRAELLWQRAREALQDPKAP